MSSLRSGLSPPSGPVHPRALAAASTTGGWCVCSRDVFQCGVSGVGSCQRRHQRRVVIEWDGMEQGEKRGVSAMQSGF